MTQRGDVPTLARKLLALRSRLRGYQPEKYYMRGPGPKTFIKLGEMYRTEADGILQEKIPEQWLSLIRSLGERGR